MGIELHNPDFDFTKFEFFWAGGFCPLILIGMQTNLANHLFSQKGAVAIQQNRGERRTPVRGRVALLKARIVQEFVQAQVILLRPVRKAGQAVKTRQSGSRREAD